MHVEDDSPGGHTIRGIPTSITAFVGRALRGPVDEPMTVTSFLDWETLYGGLCAESGLGFAVRDFYRNGGSTAVIVRVHRPGRGSGFDAAAFVGEGKRAARRGLYALEKTDLFNLLVIPPYRANGDVEPALVDAAVAYAEERRAVVLIDPPSSWTSTSAAVAGVPVATSSPNAALYFPRLRQPNPLRDNKEESFAPSGAVAGVIARTDDAGGVWKAPAGLDANLVGVTDVSVPLGDADIGVLNPVAINCLRAVPGAGVVVWGTRTRHGDDGLASDWKYLPVRRTALFLEESLHRGTRWVAFEPNDESLWSTIRIDAEAFMNTLFRQGAFAGTTSRDAYFVKCDRETMTQNDIDDGIVNVVVGFAPLKPAEFVIVQVRQTTRPGR